jgi:hypothetical protein
MTGLIEAQLVYKPVGMGSGLGSPIPLGRTSEPSVLRSLRDRLLADAKEEAELFADHDPGVAALQRAEANRLAEVLEFLVPNEDQRANVYDMRGGWPDDAA